MSINIIFCFPDEAFNLDFYYEVGNYTEDYSVLEYIEDSNGIWTVINVISFVYTLCNLLNFYLAFSIFVFKANTSSVEMKDNATGSVKITYFSWCWAGEPLRETNKCLGLRIGNIVQFTGK